MLKSGDLCEVNTKPFDREVGFWKNDGPVGKVLILKVSKVPSLALGKLVNWIEVLDITTGTKDTFVSLSPDFEKTFKVISDGEKEI